MDYEIIFGNGTAWVTKKTITVDEPTTDYGALIDLLIDTLESEGEEQFFLKPEETVECGGEHYEDEYIVGGNHSRILYTGGILEIREKEREKDIDL